MDWYNQFTARRHVRWSMEEDLFENVEEKSSVET